MAEIIMTREEDYGLICNFCKLGIQDTLAYRTLKCNHFLCVKCITSKFVSSSNTNCLFCNLYTTLEECVLCDNANIDPQIASHMSRILISSTSLAQMMSTYEIMSSTLVDLNNFIHKQIIIRGSVSNEMTLSLLDEVNRLREDQVEMGKERQDAEQRAALKYQRLQSELSQTSRALNEVNDAYNDKLQKCQAWEKAYSTLRQQIMLQSDDNVAPSQALVAENRSIHRNARYRRDRDESILSTTTMHSPTPPLQASNYQHLHQQQGTFRVRRSSVEHQQTVRLNRASSDMRDRDMIHIPDANWGREVQSTRKEVQGTKSFFH